MSGAQPITERSNARTQNIDVAPASEIVTLLGRCDREIFEGWEGSQGINHGDVIATVSAVADAASRILQEPESSKIVLSGCGTSGRLGFMVVREFNAELTKQGVRPLYDYSIAGGDVALFESREAPEDDPHAGVASLKKLTENCQRVLYIGITCGFSAPFVAGQLEHCMDNLGKFTPVLLGFNPVEMARNNKIEGWDKTFRDVAHRMEELKVERKSFILNPIIGPEPITGSSRMKSGSATKILLESIFTRAHQQAFNASSKCPVAALLQAYSRVKDVVYTHTPQLTQLVTLGAHSLQAGGRIFYIGYDSLGIVGIIDASECPPTYGAAFDDVRGFVQGGYETLKNHEGDISGQVEISIEYFKSIWLPQLDEKDLVVFLLRGNQNINEDDSDIFQSKAETVIIRLLDSSQNVPLNLPCKTVIDIPLGINNLLYQAQYHDQTVTFCTPFWEELAFKWICNALTTGAHVLKGKIYQNYMVDVKVSNNKLFHRAVGIVQKFGNCSSEEAKTALLRAIHEVPDVPAQLDQAPVSTHILQATSKDKVVPIAIVLSILGCSLEEARKALKQSPVIRTAIAQCLLQT